MKKIAISFLLFLTACGGSVVTMQKYCDIPMGMQSQEVRTNLGAPYLIHNNDDGSVDYEYIERMRLGKRVLEERHYYIRIKDNKVISKWIKYQSTPPYDINSYDLQTSMSGDDDLSQNDLEIAPEAESIADEPYYPE